MLHGNAPQPGLICFEVSLDALKATDMLLKHMTTYRLREKTDDGRQTWETHPEMSSMTHAFLKAEYFPIGVNTSHLSHGGPGLARGTPLNGAVTARCREKRALTTCRR